MAEMIPLGLNLAAALIGLCTTLYCAVRRVKAFCQETKTHLASPEFDPTMPPFAAGSMKSQDPATDIVSDEEKQKYFHQVMVENQTRMHGAALIMLLVGHVLQHFQLQRQLEETNSVPASTHWYTYLLCLATVMLSCWITIERVRGVRFVSLLDIFVYVFIVHMELSAASLVDFLLMKPSVIAAQLVSITLCPTPYLNSFVILGNAMFSSWLFWEVAVDIEVDEMRRWVVREFAVACLMIIIMFVISKTKMSALNAELGRNAYNVVVLSLRWLLKYFYDVLIELDEKFMIVSGADELEKLLFRNAGSLHETCFFDVVKDRDEASHVQRHFANIAELNNPLHARLRDSTGRTTKVQMFCAMTRPLQKLRYVVAMREDHDSWRGEDSNAIELHPADVATCQSAATAGPVSRPRPNLLGTPADLQQQNLALHSAPASSIDMTLMSSSADCSLAVHSTHEITPKVTEDEGLLAIIQRWNVNYEFVRCCAYHAKVHEARNRLRELQRDACWHHDDDLRLRQCPVCLTVLPFFDGECATCRLIGRDLT